KIVIQAVLDLFADEERDDDKELRDDELPDCEDAAKADAAGVAAGAVMLILQTFYRVEAGKQQGRRGACESGKNGDQQRQKEEAAGMVEPVGMEIGRDEAGKGLDEERRQGHGQKRCQ